MKDADSPGDGEAVAPATPQLPEAKPFTVGKSSKRSAMPRAELIDEPVAAMQAAMSTPLSAPILAMLPNSLAAAANTGGIADPARDEVFTHLVRADSDIVGLVAYSIHKQNEHDWLQAFTKTNNKPPDAAEIGAYLLGESTPRRLATYRHLAEATLAGKGPEVPAGDGSEAYRPSVEFAAPRYMPSPARTESRTGRGATLLAYIGLAVVFVVAVLLAARYGIPGVSDR